MTNLSTMEYKELQAMAKENGIPANLSKPNLVKVLTGLMMSEGISVAQEQPTEQPNPYAGFFQDKRSSQQKTQATMASMGYAPSDGQLKLARDLYTRHRLDTTALNGMTGAQVKAEIDRLINAPLPISDKQRELITTTVEMIRELASSPSVQEQHIKYQNLNVPDEVLNTLTAGQDGTASALIEKLFAIRNELNEYAPPSDGQLDVIASWILCPDIPFEEYQISKKVDLEQGWRYKYFDEFKEEIKSRMTKPQASKFIDDNRHLFYDWQKTRITQSQINYIRNLEERMSNLSSPSAQEFAMDESGNIIPVQRKKQREYNPNGYVPLDEMVLRQLSYDDASRMIDQMKSELARPKTGSIDNNPSQQRLEDKRVDTKQYDTKGQLLEKVKIENVLHKFKAVLDYEIDDIFELLDEVMIHGIGKMGKVRIVLTDLIDVMVEDEYASVADVIDMSMESQVMNALVQALYPLEYDQIVNGKQRFEQETAQPAPAPKQDVAMNFINNL